MAGGIDTMRITSWQHHRNSSLVGKAIIEVDAGTPADILDMIRLVDGPNTPNFGVTVRCLGSADRPNYGALPGADTLAGEASAWEVTVHRD